MSIADFEQMNDGWESCTLIIFLCLYEVVYQVMTRALWHKNYHTSRQSSLTKSHSVK